MDKQWKWICAPRPTMSDSMYNLDYTHMSKDEYESIKDKCEVSSNLFLLFAKYYFNYFLFQWSLKETEILFDAATMTRCGKDVFMCRSKVANYLGIEWMRRDLAVLTLN
jgi:hypothetical protein